MSRGCSSILPSARDSGQDSTWICMSVRGCASATGVCASRGPSAGYCPPHGAWSLRGEGRRRPRLASGENPVLPYEWLIPRKRRSICGQRLKGWSRCTASAEVRPQGRTVRPLPAAWTRASGRGERTVEPVPRARRSEEGSSAVARPVQTVQFLSVLCTQTDPNRTKLNPRKSQ